MSLNSSSKKFIKILSIRHILARRKPEIYRTFTVFEIAVVEEKDFAKISFTNDKF